MRDGLHRILDWRAGQQGTHTSHGSRSKSGSGSETEEKRGGERREGAYSGTAGLDERSVRRSRDRCISGTHAPSGEKIVVRPIQKRPVLDQDGPSTKSASHALSYLLACGAGRRRISSRTNEAGCAHAYHRSRRSATDTDDGERGEGGWRGGRERWMSLK